MATFTFKAVDLAGVPARGELEAESKQSVTDQLRDRGLIVLDINENKTSVTSQDLFERFKRIKPQELTVMTRQLATMVASGMSILRCFHVLEDTTENDKLRQVLGEVRQDIEAGISMADSLEKHPDVFNELYIAMTRTGESAGMLEESLERVADQMEKQDSLRRQVRAAMAYPMMIGIFAVVVLLALVAFLIPVFEEVFADFNGELPFITKLSVGMSKALRGQWYLIIGGTFALVIGIRKWKKSSWGRWQWDKIRL
jgi:type IV pilus assembly protein PilC